MRTAISCVLALSVLLGQSAWAAASEADAQTIVQETTEKVLETLRAEGDALKSEPQRLYRLIDDLILPHFDFRQMAQWVLGRHWRQASPQQRDLFVREFESLLVATYSRALVDYRNQKVDFLPARKRSEGEVTVRANIEQPGGPTIPITYEMHRTGGGWKVYDVSVDGVSLVITYRSSFNQEIKRGGIDGLIKRLEEKNRAANG